MQHIVHDDECGQYWTEIHRGRQHVTPHLPHKLRVPQLAKLCVTPTLLKFCVCRGEVERENGRRCLV
jgi:hypothetical protein